MPHMSLRMDRIATLYAFHPLAAYRLAGRGGVPILMYHSISDAEDPRHPYFQTTTSPARFAEHMRFLRENGYTPVRLTEAMNIAAECRNQAMKPVVITFDDGYRNFYSQAYPVLAEHGFTANMFLPTGYIANQRLSFNGIECMTWDEVRELNAAGIEFGSHTVTHPKLKDLGMNEIENELRGSKEAIEDHLGTEAGTFSYPFAFPETMQTFVGRLRDALLRCEYRVGVSTRIGTATAADDSLFLRRLPVNLSDDLPLFRAKLEGGYDWLHGVQRLKKLLGSIAGR